MDQFTKALNERRRLIQNQVSAGQSDAIDWIEKGKSLPIGTERKRGNHTYVKTATG